MMALFASEVLSRGIFTPYPQEIVYSIKNGDFSQKYKYSDITHLNGVIGIISVEQKPSFVERRTLFRYVLSLEKSIFPDLNECLTPDIARSFFFLLWSNFPV